MKSKTPTIPAPAPNSSFSKGGHGRGGIQSVHGDEDGLPDATHRPTSRPSRPVH